MKNRITLLLIAGIISGPSLAKTLTFTPSINLEETYSDNLLLTRDDKQGGLVSQFNVDLNSDYESKASSFSLSSRSTYLLNSFNSDLNNDFHRLTADGSVQLWPNGISLTGIATIRNEARNIAASSSDSLIFSDTVQTQNYQTGLEYSINNRHHRTSSSLNFSTSSSEDNIGERTSTSFDIDSRNGNAARYVFWDSDVSYVENNNSNNDSQTEQSSADVRVGLITDYGFVPFVRYFLEDNSGNVSTTTFETESYGAGFRWLILPRLFVDVSYNKPFGNSSDSIEEQESYADAELNWQPSSRTQLELGYTQRFFGDSYDVQLRHASRRLTNTLSYTETVRAFSRDNFQNVSNDILCSNANATDINDCILLLDTQSAADASSTITVNSLELVEDNSFSLNKVFSWTSSLILTRTRFTSNVRYTSRENLSDDSSSENLTKFISIRAERSISENSAIGLETSFTDRRISTASNVQNDLNRRYGLLYRNTINDELSFTTTFRHDNRGSTVENFNYTENRLVLTLNKDF